MSQKLHSDTKTVQSLHIRLTCPHPECCTGSSSRTPERIFHMKSCTVVDLCSTCSRRYINETTRPQPGLSRKHVAMCKLKRHYHLRRSSTFLCLISSSEAWAETSWRFLLGLSDDFIFLVLHFFTLPGTHHQPVLWLLHKAWGRQAIWSYYSVFKHRKKLNVSPDLRDDLCTCSLLHFNTLHCLCAVS